MEQPRIIEQLNNKLNKDGDIALNKLTIQNSNGIPALDLTSQNGTSSFKRNLQGAEIITETLNEGDAHESLKLVLDNNTSDLSEALYFMKTKSDGTIETFNLYHEGSNINFEGDSGENIDTDLLSRHLSNANNPHKVSIEQIGAMSENRLIVNPNLLDNWYFGNPVNRNGLTEYTDCYDKVTIDRWKSRSSGLTVIVNDDSITLTNNSTDSAVYWTQYFNDNNFSAGKYTYSILVTGVSGTVDSYNRYGSIYPYNKDAEGAESYLSAKNITSAGLFSVTNDISNCMSRVQIQVQVGCSITLKAIKLELGDTQTLARQENGNWVLNEIPNYAEQMATCSQYDPTTGEYVGIKDYLPLTGGTLTGSMSISSSSGASQIFLEAPVKEDTGFRAYTSIYKNASNTVDYGTNIVDLSFNSDTDRTMINICHKKSELKEKVRLLDRVSGTETAYLLYGEHNKPTAADVNAMSIEGTLSETLDNTELANGFYRISNYTDTSTPLSGIYGNVIQSPGNFRTQLVYGSTGSSDFSLFGRRYMTTAKVWTAWKKFWGEGDSVTSAVWNDYAEYREADTEEFGRVLIEKGDDTLTMSTERLQSFAGISSDTWGFCQGETDKAKTPIAVAGRVLAYTYEDRDSYQPGDCVCAAPGGTVSKMSREEVIQWPDRIVGTVSCVPTYEEWGGGEHADRPAVKVDGRIWIKVK